MNKIIAYLLLLLLLAGNFLPCCSDEDCGDVETCSPFSSCATCKASVDFHYARVELAERALPSIQHQSIYLVQLGHYHPRFFQPPRG